MIDPLADVVDLDPQSWAWLSEAVADGRRRRRWGYVLHEGGNVVSVHPDDLATVRVGDPVGDPGELAGRVLAGDPVSRAVVIDRRRLAELARTAAGLIAPDDALTAYRERVHDAYWSSDAVTTSPAPPPNPWREARRFTESVGDGVVVLAVVAADGTPRVALRAEVRAGVVHRLTAPTVAAADDLDRLGATELVVVDESVFRQAVTGDAIVTDVLAAGRRHTDPVTVAAT